MVDPTSQREAGSAEAELRGIAAHFDPGALPEAYFEDPHPFFRALRSCDPVHRCADGSVYLTRYRDLVEVYRQPRRWSSDKREVFRGPFGESPLYEHHTTSLVFNDPPLHTRVRQAIGDALSPRAAVAMEPSVQALVDGLLDAIAARGKFDLVEDFAAAIPVEVIGNLLRVPHDERGPLRGWSLAILGALEFQPTEALLSEGNRAVEDFVAYLEDFVARRRHELGDEEDDILARLLRFESDGFRLTGRTLHHQLIFVLNAGHETTTNLISNGVIELLRHPDQLARLRADPDRIDSCVEELLRFVAPIQLNNRRAVGDDEIGGVEIPAGTNVTLCIAAANRDPEVFEDPEALDIGRDPNPHLAFGTGIHTCAGLSVARLEGRIAIGSILSRFAGLELTGAPRRAHRARFRVVQSAPMHTGKPLP